MENENIVRTVIRAGQQQDHHKDQYYGNHADSPFMQIDPFCVRAFFAHKNKRRIRFHEYASCLLSFDSAVCALHLTGAEASRANIDVAGRTLYDCFYALDIGLPCTVGTAVRVRNLDTKCNALAADFTFCHSWHLLYRLVNSIYSNIYTEKNQAFFADS